MGNILKYPVQCHMGVVVPDDVLQIINQNPTLKGRFNRAHITTRLYDNGILFWLFVFYSLELTAVPSTAVFLETLHEFPVKYCIQQFSPTYQLQSGDALGHRDPFELCFDKDDELLWRRSVLNSNQ